MADQRSVVRRTFVATTVVGVGGAVVAALGGNHAWATIDDSATVGGAQSLTAVAASVQQATAPLVSSLALVVLAAWGVVLVSRGRPRRAVAWLSAAVAVVLLVAAVAAWVEAPRQVRDAVADDSVAVHHTAWAVLAVLGAMLAVSASAVAVLRVRAWPEMGRRYDAPTGGGPATAPDLPAEERTNLDLWRAIDEGRDPTERRET